MREESPGSASLLCTLACALTCACSFATLSCHTALGAPTAKKLYGRVDELAGAMHGAGIKIESLSLPTKVTEVRMGSPAFYAGLEAGDQVEKINRNDDVMQVIFRRQGKIYGATMRTRAPDNKSQNSDGTVTKPRHAPRTLQVKTAQWNFLKGYDIAILIDRSGSMGDPAPNSSQTKWEAMRKVLADFAKEAETFAGKKFKVVTFNDGMQVTDNVTPGTLYKVFSGLSPQGATDLISPLNAVFNDHFVRAPQNKLLITVLTDGEPENFQDVGRTIIAASNKINENADLQITFLGIGENDVGEGVLSYFDDGLLSDGAKFDVVDQVDFQDLSELGLAGAIMESMKRPRSSAGPYKKYEENELSRMLKRLKNNDQSK